MQESHSAKVRQSCFSDLFSLQSKQLQPDYVSYFYFLISAFRECLRFVFPGVVGFYKFLYNLNGFIVCSKKADAGFIFTGFILF